MLQMMVTKKLGRRQFHFTVQGKNLHEVVVAYERLSFPDLGCCALCGSGNLDLTARKSQGKFEYTSVRCLDCRGGVDFGKRQEDADTFYLRKTENGAIDWRPYNAKEEGGSRA